MNSGKSPILVADGLSKSFFKGKKEIPVLQNVQLEVGRGEMLAITGASGVGKSTLLHILGTLEPPTRGRILFYGPKGTPSDVSKFDEKALSRFRNRMLGFVFQFHYLLPEFSALENVMLPALIAGHPRAPSEKQAKDLLKFVGLQNRLEHRPAELSGGEQQRVAVARSVILRPKVLMADELTGNLDSNNGRIVMDLLAQLNESTGVSILLVTHDLDLAGKMHRVLTMKDGQLVSQTT